MLTLLAPILAQLVTLNVGDRTAVRYLSVGNTHLEGSTAPSVGLNFGWKRGSIGLAYSPSFTVRPLERSPREVLVFQFASVNASYAWRKTTLSLMEGLGYGQFTLQVQALADPGANPASNPTPGSTTSTGGTNSPTTPGGTTPGGTNGNMAGTTKEPNPRATNQLKYNDQVIRYGTSTTTVALAHTVSRTVAVGANASYSIGSGLGDSKDEYPLITGARVGAFASHSLVVSRRDDFTSSIAAQYSVSSLGNRAWSAFANEGWAHKLDGRTSTRLSGGLAATRFSQNDGLIGYSIYPTFSAGINYTGRFEGGRLSLGATVGAAPYLDTLRATVDPRLGAGLGAGWSRKRFYTGLGAGAAISLSNDNKQGAVNSVGASIGAGYQLADSVSLDGGASTGWQTFEGTTIIPKSWSGFIGITFGTSVPLNGGARR